MIEERTEKEMEKISVPKWQREIEHFKGIKSAFIIEGNINDLYVAPEPDGGTGADSASETVSDLKNTVRKIFDRGSTKGHYRFLYVNPVFGFEDVFASGSTENEIKAAEELLKNRRAAAERTNGEKKEEGHSDNKPVKNSELVREILTHPLFPNQSEGKKSTVVIFEYASRLLTSPDSMSVDDETVFLNLYYGIQNAIRENVYINTLVLIVDKLNDIPAWFYLKSPFVRTVNVPDPDRESRTVCACEFFSELAKDRKAMDKFIDITDGMKLRELDAVRRLRLNLGFGEDRMKEVVSVYKYGFTDSPWEMMRDKLGATGDDIVKDLSARVKGQDQALRRVAGILQRSVTGLSGMQHSAEISKPRGILFLAGPTGTGKTETVKAVTELLFGDERALLRFDMSEYTAEQSDQKLFGAPPGYVGYDNGGQLTNAVRNDPCSVLLFDEIEKAHPSIMDKFLQILEDGRMTDGQGNTVYFGETLIFFTSNIGISQEIVENGKVVGRKTIVKPGETYDSIKKKVEDAMRVAFKPEVINRIGENIVVFNYIEREASDQICRSKIAKINENILKKKGYAVEAPEEILAHLCERCMDEEVRLNGGRGIGNVIEAEYLNPLSDCVFNERVERGDAVRATISNGAVVFHKAGGAY